MTFSRLWHIYQNRACLWIYTNNGNFHWARGSSQYSCLPQRQGSAVWPVAESPSRTYFQANHWLFTSEDKYHYLGVGGSSLTPGQRGTCEVALMSDTGTCFYISHCGWLQHLCEILAVVNGACPSLCPVTELHAVTEWPAPPLVPGSCPLHTHTVSNKLSSASLLSGPCLIWNTNPERPLNTINRKK